MKQIFATRRLAAFVVKLIDAAEVFRLIFSSRLAFLARILAEIAQIFRQINFGRKTRNLLQLYEKSYNNSKSHKIKKLIKNVNILNVHYQTKLWFFIIPNLSIRNHRSFTSFTTFTFFTSSFTSSTTSCSCEKLPKCLLIKRGKISFLPAGCFPCFRHAVAITQVA